MENKWRHALRNRLRDAHHMLFRKPLAGFSTTRGERLLDRATEDPLLLCRDLAFKRGSYYCVGGRPESVGWNALVGINVSDISPRECEIDFQLLDCSGARIDAVGRLYRRARVALAEAGNNAMNAKILSIR
jgi:hypothetical protein